ncbi:MAG: DEAD/DEAH box helicase [Parcubacteria group bacterium]|nr:DEAD/DEAH box helicase [Parcubacteria group bacterium]
MTFNELGIMPKILEVLEKQGFVTPTPIQEKSIPAAIEGKDVIGVAQTGTGKTLAFGIPMLQRLSQDNKSCGLVVLPTRELALQVEEAIRSIGAPFNVKTVVIIGGQHIGRQMHQLRGNPRIIIATPGRLVDHLNRKTVNLNRVSTLVLDEADRMLDMGFAPSIKQIIRSTSSIRQTMLFSATMPPKIAELAKKYMCSPIKVEVSPSGTVAENVTQEVYFIRHELKKELLKNILAEREGSALVFLRTKFAVKKLAHEIRRMGYSSTEIHSNRSLAQRLRALSDFKKGVCRVMVATDIAARGIDVSNIDLVVNYDLPENSEDFVHRIGRTGRAGLKGHAVSFAMPNQKYNIREIERLIKKQLIISTPSEEIRSRARELVGTSSPNPSNERSGSFKSRSNGNSFSNRGKSKFNSRKGKSSFGGGQQRNYKRF